MIGLGTAAIGRPQYINIRQKNQNYTSLKAFRQHGWEVLDEAYRRGIRYFDTAPGYGMAEQLLIDWLQSQSDPVIEVATKWGYTYTANFDPNARQHEVKEHSISKLNEQWKQSRNLLPHLTTYQIHSATFETGVLENEAVLYRLAELKAKHDLIIGITTSGDNQIEVVRRALDVVINNTEVFDAFQVTYNILDQSLSDIATELHDRNKRMIIKEALANGRLFPNENYAHYQPLYNTLEYLARKYEVGIDAIALRFCIDTLHPYSVLSGAANSQHLIENLKATEIKLAKKETEQLKGFKISPPIYWNERKKLTWN